MWCDKRGNKQIQQQGSTYIALYALIIMWILFFLSFVSFKFESAFSTEKISISFYYCIVALSSIIHWRHGAAFLQLVAPISAQK